MQERCFVYIPFEQFPVGSLLCSALLCPAAPYSAMHFSRGNIHFLLSVSAATSLVSVLENDPKKMLHFFGRERVIWEVRT